VGKQTGRQAPPSLSSLRSLWSLLHAPARGYEAGVLDPAA